MHRKTRPKIAGGVPTHRITAKRTLAAPFHLFPFANRAFQTRVWSRGARRPREHSTNDINLRIREAIGYVENCCMDGDITVDVPSGSAQLWCPNVGTDPQYPPADCVNQVDGACTNPNHPDSNRFPISTILRSNISPRALTWCGCTANGDPTTGYSGRCFGDRDSDYYTKYKDFKPPSWGSLTEGLAVEICNRA